LLVTCCSNESRPDQVGRRPLADMGSAERIAAVDMLKECLEVSVVEQVKRHRVSVPLAWTMLTSDLVVGAPVTGTSSVSFPTRGEGADMRILVVGGFDPDDERADRIRAVCRAVGQAVAVHGHTLLNGARSELDALVAEAASEALKDSSQEDRNRRIVGYFLAGEEPVHDYGTLIQSELKNWELGSSRKLYVPEPVAYADVVVLIAGSAGTNRTANWARIAGKPLLPLASYGGAADQVYGEELQTFGQNYDDRIERDEFLLLKSRQSEVAHATNIIALAEKVVQSRSVVVVMSYDERPDLEDAYETFKSICKDLGYVCERVTEKNTATRILPEILERIRRAAFTIVDLTGLKPNVFYELGYADGAGGKVIVTAKKGTRLPFDVKDIPTILWEGQKKLGEDLRDRIQSVIKSAIPDATPPIGPS
jgi:hypothetical protein